MISLKNHRPLSNMNNRKRVAGLILMNGKVLLIRRVRNDRGEYYVLPGGAVEDGETNEEALIREIKEETSLDVSSMYHLFNIHNGDPNNGIFDQDESYFLVKPTTSDASLGGPEKERMTDDDQYHLEWHNLLDAVALPNLMPPDIINKLQRLPITHLVV
jgi:8-oxo-dGTP diphosphatase